MTTLYDKHQTILKSIFAIIVFVLSSLHAFHYHIVWNAPFAYNNQPSSSHNINKNHNNGKNQNKKTLFDIVYPKVAFEGDERKPQIENLLKQYYHLGKPLLIKGGTKHWPAYKKWNSLDYLKSIIGGNTDIVLQTDVTEQRDKPFVATTFKAFIDWLKKHPTFKETKAYKDEVGATYYIAEEFDFLEKYPKLYKDMVNLTDFDFFKNTLKMVGGDNNQINSYGFETAFWMGGAGAKTGWHYDYDYSFNVLCHLKGEKTFYISEPTGTKYLYPSKKFDPGAILSSVDFWAPDTELYPKYKHLHYEAIDLNPGDMLFIPAGYWHAVESISHSVSVSIRLMPKYLWVVNSIDRLWEMFLLLGWYQPFEGTVVHTKTIHVDSL